MRIDEVDLCEIPGGEAHLQQGEMAIVVGDFEPTAFDDGSAVALAQSAPLGAGEGQSQRRGIRAGPRHVGAGEEARERRVVDLAVSLAVIVMLDPGLRRRVEPGQSEIVDTLEHGHQPTFD